MLRLALPTGNGNTIARQLIAPLTMNAVVDENNEFYKRFHGSFTGILRWEDLATLWETIRTDKPGGWYIYAVGGPPPTEVASSAELGRFIEELDSLLKKEHQESYCGVVYVDDKKEPAFIKVYDPNNLGVVCGSSESPPPPGWILSTIPPCSLSDVVQQSGSRRRWWNRLFG